MALQTGSHLKSTLANTRLTRRTYLQFFPDHSTSCWLSHPPPYFSITSSVYFFFCFPFSEVIFFSFLCFLFISLILQSLSCFSVEISLVLFLVLCPAFRNLLAHSSQSIILIEWMNECMKKLKPSFIPPHLNISNFLFFLLLPISIAEIFS